MNGPLDWNLLEKRCEAQSPYEANTYSDRIFKVVSAFKPKRMIEIGVMRGDSTEAITRAMLEYGNAKLISIDPGDSAFAAARVQPRLGQHPEANVEWEYYQWLSHDAFERAGWDDIDLVYIDGDHELQGVAQDWQDYGRNVKVVLLDDTDLPGPHRVAQEAIATEKYEWYQWTCINQAPYTCLAGRLHEQTLLVEVAEGGDGKSN